MAVPAGVDEFIDLVRKSGVADEKRLDVLLAKLRPDMPADAPKAAGLLVHHGILTNFQAENILAGKWRRFSIGKYKVLERLGSGGFAQVYLCEHKLMRRRVAVKVLPVAKTKDSSALARFHREARAAAQLDHLNIVHAYDVDQDEDLHFLVMEYIDGANLQEIVKRSGPLTVERACHYMHQAALGLQHAHEHELVHRDIKPGNILVDRTGVVKLLDLGLALSFAEVDDQLTKKHDDGTLGTADYLSPEQAMDSHDVDIRTDIYSLGVTFYFLLTGRPPFEGLPIAQKLLAHQMKQPKPLTDIRKDVPAAVMAVIDKMMAKKVSDRYATPGDVADALSPFTQTAIDPPTETEMPRLSPAATGQPIAEGETATTAALRDTPVTPPRTPPSTTRPVSPIAGNKPPATTKSPSAAPIAPKPMPTAASIATAPKPSKPTPKPVPKPAPAPEVAPWEQTAAETPTAGDDTPSSHRFPKFGRPQTKSNPMIVITLVMAFVIIPIILISVIGFVIWHFFPSQVAPDKGAPPKLEVSRDGSRKGYASIQAAVRDVPTDGVIELWDDTYDENVVIEPSRGRTRITLQAAPGKEIVWRSAKNDPGQPILTLNRAADFKLKGKGITFDGTMGEKKRQVNDLVMVAMDVPGLALEDAQFKNFARSAVFLINATGNAKAPIKLQRLATDGDKGQAAIYFDANQRVLPPYNDHIDIEDCDFRGHDPAKAIQFKSIKDGTVFGEHVRWPGK